MIKKIMFLFSFMLLSLLASCGGNDKAMVSGYLFSNTFLDYHTIFISMNSKVKLTSDNGWYGWYGPENDIDNKLVVVGTNNFSMYICVELENNAKSMVIKTSNDIIINEKSIKKDEESIIDLSYVDNSKIPSVIAKCNDITTIEILTFKDSDGKVFDAWERKKITLIPSNDLLNIDDAKESFTINDKYELISVTDKNNNAINNDKYDFESGPIIISYYAIYNDTKLECKRTIDYYFDSSKNKHIRMNNFEIN